MNRRMDKEKLQSMYQKTREEWIKSDSVYHWVRGGWKAPITVNVYEILYKLNLIGVTIRVMNYIGRKEKTIKTIEDEEKIVMNQMNERILSSILQEINFKPNSIHNAYDGSSLENRMNMFYLGLAINCFSDKIREELYSHFQTTPYLTQKAKDNFSNIYIEGRSSFKILRRILKVYGNEEQKKKFEPITEKIKEEQIIIDPVDCKDRYCWAKFITDVPMFRSVQECAKNLSRVLRIIHTNVPYAMKKVINIGVSEFVTFQQSSIESLETELRKHKLCISKSDKRLYTALDALDLIRCKITFHGVKFRRTPEDHEKYKGWKLHYIFYYFWDYENTEIYNRLSDEIHLDSYSKCINRNLDEKFKIEMQYVNRFIDLTFLMADRDPIIFAFLINYVCWLAQNPGSLSMIILFLYGPQGCGKSTWINIVCSLFPTFTEQNITRIEEVAGTFNSAILWKIIVVINELYTTEGRQISFLDLLKPFSTEPTIRIGEKYIPVFTVMNVINLMLAANEIPKGRIDPYDRRLLSLQCSNERMGDRDYFSFAYISSDSEFIKPELSTALLAWAKCQRIGNFHPAKDMPQTGLKISMTISNLSINDRVVLEFYEELKSGISGILLFKKVSNFIDTLKSKESSRYALVKLESIITFIRTICSKDKKCKNALPVIYSKVEGRYCRGFKILDSQYKIYDKLIGGYNLYIHCRDSSSEEKYTAEEAKREIERMESRFEEEKKKLEVFRKNIDERKEKIMNLIEKQ